MYAALHALRRRYAAAIERGFPKLARRVSGYNLDRLLPAADGRINLARALVGSEGTCVTMLEATLRLVEYHRHTLVVAAGYEDVYRVGAHVPAALAFQPLAVEGMDRRLYEHVLQKHLPQRRYLGVLPRGGGWLLIQLGSNDPAELRARAERLMSELARSTRPVEVKLVEKQEEQDHLWKVREAGLGATAFVPGERDTWPGLEDSAVPPEKLGQYLPELRALFEKYGYDPSLYGHFGMGCVHCRVDFDLTSRAGIAAYRAFMNEAADLIVAYGGSLSAEHGDGQSRAELLYKMFGPELVGAFREFKAIWDPSNKMNPGRIVEPRPLDADLRLGAAYDPAQPETHFRFPDDGGSFARATLRCVGVGKCRRLAGEPEDDTMCPSFMVTREEKHSTRGRAHLLWEMLRGEPSRISGGFRDEHVKEALELCLACKGCKGDCPVNVDVATYKAEFLSHYYETRLRPRHAYAFGWLDRAARLASLAPGFTNLLTQTPGLAGIAKRIAGITPERDIPAFAGESFRSWFSRRRRTAGLGPKVLLWPDTFNNYFHPETARAAVQVLEHLGFEVVIPDRILCCGRPLYDYGMLGRARAYLERVLDVMKPYIDAGTPMVVLEPSCCSVFRDEMLGLMPSRVAARHLKEQTLLLGEFLMRHAPAKLPRLERRAVVQGHCHHKAIMRFGRDREVFSAMQLDAKLLASGCCGMAGSFGYERGKYEISQACGERALFPSVRAEPDGTFILADGFSCRTQIEQNTGRRALHLAETLALAIDEGPSGPPATVRPESRLVLERSRELARARKRALAACLLGAGAIALAITRRSFRRRRSRRSAVFGALRARSRRV